MGYLLGVQSMRTLSFNAPNVQDGTVRCSTADWKQSFSNDISGMVHRTGISFYGYLLAAKSTIKNRVSAVIHFQLQRAADLYSTDYSCQCNDCVVCMTCDHHLILVLSLHFHKECLVARQATHCSHLAAQIKWQCSSCLLEHIPHFTAHGSVYIATKAITLH